MSFELLDPEPTATGDVQELLEREGRIERTQRNAYYEIGLDLLAIREKRLYRIQRPARLNGRYSFETFEEYCAGRWEWTGERARQLIIAAQLAAKITTMVGILPARERHVRPLIERLETDDERLAVWQQLVADAPERITAILVDDYITRYIAARDKEFVTLEEWQGMTKEEQAAALAFNGASQFNKQDGSEERSTQSIEWAQWSWNPVTGCKHACPYCYARDIAHRFYPMKFEPAFWHKRLGAPANTRVPQNAATDISYRNVFTCSMADLFGRWVPDVWIEAVLDRVAANPQWNFLFLTKFASRLRGFKFPENAWIGTTVDCQARVKAAEEAFAHVDAAVKWISVEPMIEPLQFKHLDRFQWLVIGGASKSSQTPEWRVPIHWWAPLYQQALEFGLQVYLKSNLFERVRGYPGSSWPVVEKAPDSFAYLKAKSKDEIVLGESA